MGQKREDELYIPHGSDERALFHAQAVLEAYTFISHMVQMKVP